MNDARNDGPGTIVYCIRTETRPRDGGAFDWRQCCLVETVSNDHEADVADAFARHATSDELDHRVSVFEKGQFGGKPILHKIRLFGGADITDAEQVIDASLAGQGGPDLIMGASGDNSEADGSQLIPDDIKVRDAKTGEEIQGAEREEIITAARRAAQGLDPSVTAYLMVTEDQLKRAAAELEESLWGVILTQDALSRKGAWWCYQDALATVARASSVLTAAYLNWEATL